MSETVTGSTVVAKSFGQELDAELAVIKGRLGVIETSASTDWSKAVAWVKAQWPHFVTWAGTAAVAVKAFGLHL